MMKNLPALLLAGGAAIVGLGFFMQKGEPALPETGVTPVDSNKRIAPVIVKNPGQLNVTSEVRIDQVMGIYS